MAPPRSAFFEHRVRTPRVRRGGFSPGVTYALVVNGYLLAFACVGAEPSRPATRGTAGIHEVRQVTEPALVSSTATTVSTLATNSTFALAPSTAPSSNSTQPNGPSSRPLDDATSFQAFRIALSDKNFEAARRWLGANTVPLDHSIQALADGVVALGLNQPEHALDSLRGIDPKLPLPPSGCVI